MNLRIILFLLCIFSLSEYITASPDLSWTKNVGARQYPDKSKSYNAVDYGAVSDGITMNTKAIQNAIDDCASKGGGIVTFSPGRYLTGSIFIKEGVHFIIPKDVTIVGSTNIKDYPEIDTRVAGIEMVWPSALINILDQKNVMISGDGIVHAQGKVFWDTYWDLRREYETKGLRWIVDYDCKRPRTLLVSESTDITIKDVTFKQAGFWTIQLLYSSYCTVDGVIIQNNEGGHGPSTDGIDIDSSSRILVQNCDIDCNDDNFCLKSGRDSDGLRVNRPTEYIVIRNCISRAGSGLFTCGSETSGGIRYVLAEGLKAKGTGVGIRLKSAMNRGGTTEHIYVKDVEMENVGLVFEATMNWNPAYSYSKLPKEYENKPIPEHWQKMLAKVPESKGIPYFKDVYLSGIKVKNSKKFMSVAGSEQSLMRNFSFDNIHADVEKIGKVNFAKDWTFANVKIKAKNSEPLEITNSHEIDFPNQIDYADIAFADMIIGKNRLSKIAYASHPEFSFLLPEMSGNLKFGIIDGEQTCKWLNELKTIDCRTGENKITYILKDPLLDRGTLIIKAIPLKKTDGIIIEVSANDIPTGMQLLWSYGGASGKILKENDTKILNPIYCKDNVFSIEHTAFTLYYGESMKLKTIEGVMPITSKIRLSDSFLQESPTSLFNSDKNAEFPVLAAILPLNRNSKEYFCIYKQNKQADYNYYMLPALFHEENS